MLGVIDYVKGIKNPEQYFKNKLGENSEDFLMLERLVEETNGRITWDKLKEYTKIENGKIEGIYWKEDLDIKLTNITSLGKIKKAWFSLYSYNIPSLKDLGELEEVGGNVDLTGTSITSLGKLKKVGWDLDLGDVSSLKDIGELEEVGGDLDIRGTSVKLQLEVIRKIRSGELKIELEIYFGGNIKGIDTLLEQEEIPGSLDLSGTRITSLGKVKKVGGRLKLYDVLSIKDLGELEEVGGNLDLEGTSVELQLEVMRKIKNGELLVEGKVHYDDHIKNIFTKNFKLNFNNFEERYGTKVDEIEGEQQEQIRQLLEYIQKVEIEDLSKGIVKILKENITEEEKKEKIAKLNDEYKVYIQKIDGYLDNKN